MAKSTTTTKAKTKTTNKKATAKAAAKSTKATSTKAKKPTAKSATKKTNATKTVQPTNLASVKTPVKIQAGKPFWKRAHVLTAGLYAVLAVAAGFLMNTASAQVMLGHLAKDELASRAGTVLAPAATVIYELEYRWLLVALLVVAAVIAVLRGTRYQARETAGIKNRVQPLRWVEFAVTGALAFEVAALLNGLQDAVALKMSMLSIVVAAIAAWMFERENAATNKPAKSTYVVAITAVIAPVVALLVTMYGTYVYGIERSPWYAYVAALIVGLALLVTVRTVWHVFKFKNGAHDYANVDRNYNRIAVASKIALALTLIIGLYAK